MYFTGLPSRRATAPGDQLLRRGLELAAEAAADVGRDHPDLGLGHAGGRREREPQDVRDLGGRPHRDLLAGRVDDDGARLHEGRDQPLLAVLALDHDAVAAGLLDGLVDVAAGAGLARVEHPERRLVGAEVGVREHLVGRGLLEVERRRAAPRSRRRPARRRRAPRPACGRRPRRRSRRRTRPGRRASAGASGATWSGVIGQALMMTPCLGRGRLPVSTATTLGERLGRGWCRCW